MGGLSWKRLDRGPSVAGMWGGYGSGGRVAFAGWCWCKGAVCRESGSFSVTFWKGKSRRQRERVEEH